MDAIYWFALACGVVSLLYGIYAVRSVFAASTGSERMQEIAAAVQEGARAYLNRQYITIGIVNTENSNTTTVSLIIILFTKG